MKPYAIYVVDPGQVSGVGRGVFDLEADSTADCVRGAFESGEAETWETRGKPEDQAQEIMGEFLDWQAVMMLRRSLEPVFIYEDFQLRQKRKLSGSSVLWPVRMAGMFDLVLLDKGCDPAVKQQPAMAMTYATNDRLRRWGLWTPASRDHRRDVVRHMCLAVSKKIS